MRPGDRELGMDRAITRRDFISGVGAAVGGSAMAGPCPAPLWPGGAEATPGPRQEAAHYPPGTKGMRGSHDGAYEVAHALRASPPPRDW